MKFFCELNQLLESSFWSSILSIISALLGALISGLIAIRIFQRGLKKQEQKEVNRLKDLKIFYETSLKQLSKPLRRQVDELQKFCRKLKERNFDVLGFKFIVGTDTTHVNTISKQELFKIYSSDNTPYKSEQFHELLTQIQLISELRKSLREYFDEYLSNFKRFEKDFQENAEGVVVLFTQFSSEAQRTNPNGDPFILGIQELFQTWKQQETREDVADITEPYFVASNLLNPIYTFIDERQRDPRSPLFASKIRNSRFALVQIDNLKKLFRKEFLLTARKFLTAELKIAESLDNLNKTEGNKR